MTNILLGITFLLIGIFVLYDVIKYPVDKNANASNTKGFVGGIFLIIIALLLLFGKVHF